MRINLVGEHAVVLLGTRDYNMICQQHQRQQQQQHQQQITTSSLSRSNSAAAAAAKPIFLNESENFAKERENVFFLFVHVFSEKNVDDELKMNDRRTKNVSCGKMEVFGKC